MIKSCEEKSGTTKTGDFWKDGKKPWGTETQFLNEGKKDDHRKK